MGQMWRRLSGSEANRAARTTTMASQKNRGGMRAECTLRGDKFEGM